MWEKLNGVEGFERLENSFKKKFRADSWEGLSSEDILKKTQAPEAEMRAAMLAEDKGWRIVELAPESPLGGGDIDEILKINGKLWYGEVKSDIPGGDINKWLTKTDIKGRNSLYKLMRTYKKVSNANWEYKGIKRLKIYLPKKYEGYRSEIMSRISMYKGRLGMEDWQIELVFFGGM